MVLTKHVIRRDHKIIGSCDFVCKAHQVTILPSFVPVGTLVPKSNDFCLSRDLARLYGLEPFK